MSQPVPEMPDSVAQALRAQGLELEPGDPVQLRAYLQALLEANERFNLTAVTDPAQAWERHIQDSLTLVPFLASSGAQRVIDVGSGGGLPGMPLAIAMPAVRFTLLEATGKKAQFLRETAQALGLHNVEVLQERAETAGQDHHAHRAMYDAVVSRAVGRLSVLAELTVPFAKEGGHILAIMGEQAFDNLTYGAMKERFGPIVLPMIKSSLAKQNPGAVLRKLNDLVKVAIRGAEIMFQPEGTTGGILQVSYPRPVAAHVMKSWQGVLRFVFEVSAPGEIKQTFHAPHGATVQYQVAWKEPPA